MWGERLRPGPYPAGLRHSDLRVVAIALVAHMDVLAVLLPTSALIVSATDVVVAGCWCSWLLVLWDSIF